MKKKTLNHLQFHAYFLDDEADFHQVDIIYDDNSIKIKVHQQLDEVIAFAKLTYESYDRIYLNFIYCNDEKRNRGIATAISELIDYIFKYDDGKIIYGEYWAYQGLNDIEKGHNKTQQELDKASKIFYKKNKYKIIKKNDFIKRKINHIGDEYFGKFLFISKPIVFKKIKRKKYHRYIERNGDLYDLRFFDIDYDDIRDRKELKKLLKR